MSWKDILKTDLTPEDEKEIENLMRFENLTREDAERKYRKKTGKIPKRNPPTGRVVKEDKVSKENIDMILREVKKEGGALGMKNLKGLEMESKELKETLDHMLKEKMLFRHKDGDLYTHKPE